MTYVAPKAFAAKYTCPHCAAVAQQQWWSRRWDGTQHHEPAHNPLRVGKCIHCGGNSVWIDAKMYYPETGTAPQPNTEMPANVKTLYLEAASITSNSPRGAAALLRLAIQILCLELGEKGKNIDDDIAALVRKGLPLIVQQSLDVVRVTGNHAVHPGQIDTDDPQVAAQLFELLNVICEYMIAMPKKVSGIYANLPQKALDAIKRRDGGQP